MRIQEAQKLTNSTDPEHCSESEGKEASHCGTSFKQHKKRNIMYRYREPAEYILLCPSNNDKEVVRFKSVNNLADKNIP
jgi:hypothetical protein